MYERMLEAAKKANELSYSPYSNYRVSCAILLKSGNIITGVNIENASYSLTICAERCGLFRCYASGYKKDDLVSMLIYTNREDSMPYPCGACRQVMAELLGLDKDVTIVNDLGRPETYKVKELLPKTFTEENL